MERRLQIPSEIDRIELFGNLDVNLTLIKEATGVDVFQRDDGLILKWDGAGCRAWEADGAEKPPAEEDGQAPGETGCVREAEKDGQADGAREAEKAGETGGARGAEEPGAAGQTGIQQMDQAQAILEELMGVLQRGETLDKQKVAYIIGLSGEGLSYQAAGVGKDVICFTHKGKPLKPKTLGQKNYVNSIRTKDIVFGVGPAGTGKTYIAVAMAINAYKNKEIQKIILARPAVEAGERLGFLPGDLQDKVDPYLRPLYDALYDILGRDAAMRLKEKEVIEVVPLAYMRGRTLDNAFIILDEAQNTTREQMKMFLTRMGFGSKVVVTGDITQIDLPRGKKSGLVEAIKVLKPVRDIDFCYLKDVDVVRHELVKKIIGAYDQYYKKYPEELQE